MNRSHLRQQNRVRGLRFEPLETRTLLHALGITLADGVLDIATLTDHDDAVLVRWDPATDSIRVLANEHEEFRAAGADVRAVNLRGLEGADMALIDTRLRLPLTYERSGALGALRVQLPGSGDGDDYCVATADCEAFMFTSDSATPQRHSEAGADNGVVRGVLFGHGGHAGAAGIDGLADDMRLMTAGLALADGHAGRPQIMGDHGMGSMYMGPMELMVKLGTKPKWHPTACTCFGQRLDREAEDEKAAKKPDCDCPKEPAQQPAAPEALPLPKAAEETPPPGADAGPGLPLSAMPALDASFTAETPATSVEFVLLEEVSRPDPIEGPAPPGAAFLAGAVATALFRQERGVRQAAGKKRQIA